MTSKDVQTTTDTDGVSQDEASGEIYHKVNLGKRSVLLPKNRSGRIGKCWANGRFYERDMLKHIRALNLSGTYIDAGMNVGNHTLFFAKVCNAASVFCFEPFLERIQRAERLFQRNKIRHKLNIFNAALSDSTGPIALKIRKAETTAIKLRLDDIAPENVSLMKIDVEGAEMAVLRGAKETILRNKPYIYVEIFDEDFDERSREICDLGYKIGRRFKTPTYEFIPILE